MGKSDQQKARGQISDNLNKVQAQGDANQTFLQGLYGESKSRADEMYPTVASGYADIASTGGYDPSVVGRLSGGYQNLATTGGIDEAGATAMRNRAAEGAKSVYSVLGDSAQRQAAAGGGSASAIELSALNRGGGQAASRAVTDTDANIAGLRQTGTIAGLSGESNLQGDVAKGRQTGVAGQASLLGMNFAQQQDAVSNILKNYQISGQLSQSDLQMLQELSKTPGLFDNIMKGISVASGAAMGVAGVKKAF
jgi:hypothetical protein